MQRAGRLEWLNCLSVFFCKSQSQRSWLNNDKLLISLPLSMRFILGIQGSLQPFTPLIIFWNEAWRLNIMETESNRSKTCFWIIFIASHQCEIRAMKEMALKSGFSDFIYSNNRNIVLLLFCRIQQKPFILGKLLNVAFYFVSMWHNHPNVFPF